MAQFRTLTYSTDKINHSLTIQIKGSYRNEQWFKEYRYAQNILLQEVLLRVTINISFTTWIDPIPILALVNDLHIAKQRNDLLQIHIVLPITNDVRLERDEVVMKRNRVVAFLENEGFLISLEKIGATFVNRPDEETKKQITQLLYYQNSLVIPCACINLTGDIKVEDFVKENLIDKHLVDINRYLNEDNRGEINLKLKTTLYELIENVKEHAYAFEDPNKFCSIYIRYRKGLINHEYGSEERKNLENLFMQENIHCPTLRADYAVDKSGFLEVFIVDSGKGFSKSFFLKDLPKKFPFRNAWRVIFKEQKRNPAKVKPTKFGGLVLLGRLLSEGYVNAFSDHEVVGDLVPSLNENAFYQALTEEIGPSGFQISFRISITDKEYTLKNWIGLDNESMRGNLFNTLKGSEDFFKKYYRKSLRRILESEDGLNIYLDDKRDIIKDSGITINKADSANGKLLSDRLYKNFKNSKVAVILSSSNLLKTNVFYELQYLFEHLQVKSKTLIIGDIKVNTVPIYESAIIGAKFDSKKHIGIEKIILITDTFFVRVLKKQDNTFKEDNFETLTYIEASSSGLFEPDKSIIGYFEFIKSYDSLVLWYYISTLKNKNEYYIKLTDSNTKNGKGNNTGIKWYSNETEEYLKGYLNFSKTLSDGFLVQLYNLWLNRLKQLQEVNDAVFHGTDSMVEKIVSEFLFVSMGTGKNKLYVGSVYVTGNTESNWTEKDKTNNFIYFFLNMPIGVQYENDTPHLFHWPNENSFVQFEIYPNKNLRRVGLTSTIAPFGWKYHKVPRYDNEENSVTYVKPTDAYADWQNTEFINLGHYEYENYHDYIKFNFPLYFDRSIKTNTKFSSYIIFKLCASVGITKDDFLDSLSKKTFEDFQSSFVEDYPQLVDFIVYPYHLTTNRIINYIKSIVKAEFQDKFVALISYTSVAKNAPFSASFLSVESISSRLKESAKKTVLIFDDVIVEQKVSRDLEYLLKDCGAKKIIKFALIDRRRLSIENADYAHNNFIWRLDIPRIGYKSECILCKAIDRAKQFSTNLTSTVCQERISNWIDTWQSTNPYLKNEQVRILPKNLYLDEPEKKFSIKVDEATGKSYQVGGDLNKIKILNSYGLSFYASEITSMTKRDDMALELCKIETLNADIRIEIACTTLILFNQNISNKTRKALLEILLKSLIESDETSNHTSLAGLLLITLSEYIGWPLFKKLLYHKENQYELKSLNLDAIIVVASISVEKRFHNILKERRIFASLIYSSELQIFEIYQQLHFQLHNPNGQIHNTALQFINTGKMTKRNLREASFCIDKINSLIKTLDHNQFNTSMTSDDTKRWIRSLEESGDELNNEIKTLYRSYTGRTLDSPEFSIEKGAVENKISALFNDYIVLYNSLFIKIDPDDEFPLENIVIDTFKRIDSPQSSMVELGVSADFIKPDYGNSIVKCFPWDKSIHRIFYFLLSNYRHNENTKIQDPSVNRVSSNKKDMWLSVSGSPTQFCIHFFNHTSRDAKFIQDKFDQKSMYEILHLKNLRGNISFVDYGSNIVETRLHIPFI